MKKVCLITGGTSGIGKSTVAALLNNGFTVYEFSRRLEGVPGTHHYSVDITDERAVDNAVSSILEIEKRIDVVINCAGAGISGAVEFTSSEEAKYQFDIIFFGMVNINHAVLKTMRLQKSGLIINLSSVAAAIPIPFQCYYSSAKAAINSYSFALANEVRPFGIKVCSVQPGDIKTGFTSARRKNEQGNEEYDGRISKSVSVMEHDEQNGMSPDSIGNFICKLATRRKIKPLYTFGAKYKLFCLIFKLLPAGFANYLVGKIYG